MVTNILQNSANGFRKLYKSMFTSLVASKALYPCSPPHQCCPACTAAGAGSRLTAGATPSYVRPSRRQLIPPVLQLQLRHRRAPCGSRRTWLPRRLAILLLDICAGPRTFALTLSTHRRRWSLAPEHRPGCCDQILRCLERDFLVCHSLDRACACAAGGLACIAPLRVFLRRTSTTGSGTWNSCRCCCLVLPFRRSLVAWSLVCSMRLFLLFGDRCSAFDGGCFR